MAQSLGNDTQFVVDLLTTLRNEKFSPLAWWRFLVRSWEMSNKTAATYLSLTRSWIRLTVFIGVLTLVTIVATFIFEGSLSTLLFLPGFLFCVAWQQSDLYWHLGLNRHPQTGIIFPTIGIANTLTWIRAFGASFLIGRLVGGLHTPSWLAFVIFLGGIVTDILDGQVARYTKTQSKLGQIGDGEADFCLYLAIIIILFQNGFLPLWLGLIMLFRFLIPLMAALASYFFFAQPVRFGSTHWGKYAGLFQTLYFLVLLTPAQFLFITQPIKLPLLLATLTLMIAAPVAQIIANGHIVRTIDRR